MNQLGQQILALHREGVPSLAIAHQLNVAQSTVHYHLRQANHGARTPRLAPARSPEPEAHKEMSQRARIAELLREGMSRVEIARRLHIAKSTVSYHARRLGEEVDQRFARR